MIVCGLWFTWRTRFMQFRMIGEMFRLLTDAAVDTAGTKKQEEDKTKKNISSFQAFIVSVATRVGTGNLAGVASAIAIGGPGAIFWMWVIALIGSATAFVESTLAQLYKQKDKDSYIGGPAYYIQNALKRMVAAYPIGYAKLYGIPADGAALFGPESYHLHDYGFFYNNFKQNVTDRVKAYMEK